MFREHDPCPRVGRAFERIIRSCSSARENRSGLDELVKSNVRMTEVSKQNSAEAGGLTGTELGGDTKAKPMVSNWDRMEEGDT